MGYYIKNLSQIESFDDGINSEASRCGKSKGISRFRVKLNSDVNTVAKFNQQKRNILVKNSSVEYAIGTRLAWIPLKSIQAARHTREWSREKKRVRRQNMA